MHPTSAKGPRVPGEPPIMNPQTPNTPTQKHTTHSRVLKITGTQTSGGTTQCKCNSKRWRVQRDGQMAATESDKNEEKKPKQRPARCVPCKKHINKRHKCANFRICRKTRRFVCLPHNTDCIKYSVFFFPFLQHVLFPLSHV